MAVVKACSASMRLAYPRPGRTSKSCRSACSTRTGTMANAVTAPVAKETVRGMTASLMAACASGVSCTAAGVASDGSASLSLSLAKRVALEKRIDECEQLLLFLGRKLLDTA